MADRVTINSLPESVLLPPLIAMIMILSLGLLTSAQLVLVHAFLPLAKGKMSLAGVSGDSIDEYVASERNRAAKEMTAFLDEGYGGLPAVVPCSGCNPMSWWLALTAVRGSPKRSWGA